MSGFSTTIQAAIANWLRGAAMPTAPTSLTVALSTAIIADDGTNLVEPGSGYARQAVTLTAPVHTEGAGTVVKNANAIIFGPALVNWTTVVSVAILDQAGNVLLKGNLAAPRGAPIDDTLSMGIGTLEFTVV